MDEETLDYVVSERNRRNSGSCSDGALEKRKPVTISQSNLQLQPQSKHHEIIEILSSDEEKEDDSHEKFNVDNDSPNVSVRRDVTNNALRDGGAELANELASKESLNGMYFTYQNSAYVQNFAEICHDILNDARWRTMGSQSKLFQWEQGDDLSALHVFSKLFNPGESLLHNGDDPEEDCSHLEINTSEEVARYMNLYARLFHRKGPWFNLSDIFMRYYHRDYLRRKSYLKKSAHNKEPINLDDGEGLEANNTADNLPCSEMISWTWIETCLIDCFSDIRKMLSHGFVRTFNSEEECGIIIGNSNSVCTMKEKQSILRKLGGKVISPTSNGRYNNKDSANFTNGSSSRQSKHQKRKQVPRVNEILNQMKSQKSIFAHSNKLLPVRKHMMNVLIESFAQKLQTLMVNAMDKLKSSEVGTKSISEIILMLTNAWKNTNENDEHGNGFQFPVCLRLREEPLRTLRRASRLYICAGNGPGNMRYDGTNAWLTILENPTSQDDGHINDAYSFVGDICTLPEPPDASLWWKVTFDGLSHRLGLKSCNFIGNYKRVSVSTTSPESLNCINIFRDLHSFYLWELVVELRNINDYLMEWNSLVLYAQRKRNSARQKTKTCLNLPMRPETNKSFDFLSKDGRLQILKQFLMHIESDLCETSIYNNIEQTILSLVQLDADADEIDCFATDAERSIGYLGLICQGVLLQYLRNVCKDEIQLYMKRPWLRHLSWQALVAYIIWDCVEVFEKRGYHEVALSLLETILYGTSSQQSSEPIIKERKSVEGFMQVLLSRRVRGKAHDRMIIDMKHSQRKNTRHIKNKTEAKKEQIKSKRKYERHVKEIIHVAGTLSSLPFSFLRKFSRKLGQTLSESLEDIINIELLELSIRLQCINMKEWAPTFDYSIANALKNDSESSTVGRRCSYIGNEEIDDLGLIQHRSLNVEELAIQEYASGNLPTVDCVSQGGGWKGCWHSEGLHIRILFRILLSERLLNYNYADSNEIKQLYNEQCTIFLNPYQSSPLDLHVGHCMLHGQEQLVAIRSFYERRRVQIDSVLHEIASLSKQELSDYVFNCVQSRKKKLICQGKKLINNPQLVQDLKEMRTLSLIAAALGGKLLAAMFRCLCYDYRQYSGGLPDLTLVRASLEEHNENQSFHRIDWAEWIGESFSIDNTKKSRSMILDRDDEFLGCALNDKQKSSSSSNNGKRTLMEDIDKCIEGKDPLQLVYNGKSVLVEAIFVEVKSVNDTLDERQEDWLNVIGEFGEARVCKFESTNKKKGK